MPSKNFRLVAVCACFTGLVYLADYEIKNDVDFMVGVLVGMIALGMTAAVLSLMDW
jgi:hypothetical protein